MDWIEKYATPLEDEERAALVREALAAKAIARATRIATAENGGTEVDWDALDEPLERVLARVSPRALNATTVHASSVSELREALRQAASLIPEPDREYTDVELEL